MNEGPQDLVRFPARALGALHRAIAEGSGATEAARAVREAGLASSDAFFDLLRDFLSEAGAGAVDPEGMDEEHFWTRLGDFFAQLGWGTLEHERVHPGVIALSAASWAEAAEGGGGGCHFTAGVLAGLLRRVAGRDLALLEVECSAGSGARCCFLVGGESALEAVYTRLREGGDYRQAISALA